MMVCACDVADPFVVRLEAMGNTATYVWRSPMNHCGVESTRFCAAGGGDGFARCVELGERSSWASPAS